MELELTWLLAPDLPSSGYQVESPTMFPGRGANTGCQGKSACTPSRLEGLAGGVTNYVSCLVSAVCLGNSACTASQLGG